MSVRGEKTPSAPLAEFAEVRWPTGVWGTTSGMI